MPRPPRPSGPRSASHPSAPREGEGRTPREIYAERSRKRREAAAAASASSTGSKERGRSKRRGSTASRSAGRRPAAPPAASGGKAKPRGRASGKERPVSDRARGRVSFGGLDVSVRLLAMSMVAVFILMMLVPSVYEWWQQERELAGIRAQVAAAEQRNADMRKQLDLWSDPNYISTQARERLGFVRPGETQYTVVDPGPEYQDSAQVNAAPAQGPARPWVQQMAILLGRADQPPQTAAAQPQAPAQDGDKAESGR